MVIEIEEATIIIGSQLLTLAQSMTVRVGMTIFLHQMQRPKALGNDEVGEEFRKNYLNSTEEVVKLISENRRGAQ